MTKNQYNSIYSPGKQCNALQYICELLCQKKADFDKIRLPLKFWDSMPKWFSFYKKNLRMVSKLLTRFDEKTIITVLRSEKFARRYSIFTEFAEDSFIKEQKKIDLERESQKVDIVRVDMNQKPRARKNKKGILGKLDDLDAVFQDDFNNSDASLTANWDISGDWTVVGDDITN